MEAYIPDANYENSFWEKADFLYEHSKLKHREYLSLSDVNAYLSEAITQFCDSLNLTKKYYQPYGNDDNSSRGIGIQKFLDFIDQIINNLKEFAQKLTSISSSIDERTCSYESKNDIKKMCEDNLIKYENSLKILATKKNLYYDSVKQVIEQYLNNKYKPRDSKLVTDKTKLDIFKKRRKEYKDQVMKTEQYRIEYIEIQRNIFSSEEEFERDSTDGIRNYLKTMADYYKELLNSLVLDEEVINNIDKINGTRDTKIFAEKNRNILTCPSRQPFMEYVQDMEQYINLEGIKNQIKNKTKEEEKEIINEIANDLREYLCEITEYAPNKNVQKYEEIANNILNNHSTEEDFNYLMNEFQNSYDNFKKWEKNYIGTLEFKKVGEDWENRFIDMRLFLEGFNKIRMHNKQLEQPNFDYLAKAMEKILYYNDNDDIDYKLCELLITLSSTFYMIEIKEDKERKKYISEIIRQTPVLKKPNFWIGLTKFEFNKEIIKEKAKQCAIASKNTFLDSIFSKKKKEPSIIKTINYDKLSEPILMSISYNLIQFITDSNSLNNILKCIFRAFKINDKNKETIIQMIMVHIEAEGFTYLQVDKEMLLTCDRVESFLENGNDSSTPTGDKNEENKEESKEEAKEEGKDGVSS